MTDLPSTPLSARLRELRQHIGPNAQNQMTCLYGDATLREISNVLVEAADQLEAADAETTRLRQERDEALNSKRVVVCQWCAESLDLNGLPLIEARQAMRDHDQTCPDNPMVLRVRDAEQRAAAAEARVLALEQQIRNLKQE